ncbi:hypothetical protein LBMAG41_29720 [Cyanobium sp.]|nr:hypothetical protein LBMAG41_29720 [Cyanobium sp.]
MTQPPTTGIAAQGPLPAGMLRIQQGSQERYVWPVHLPGWLGLGWRVAGPSTPAAELLLQSEMAPAVPPESEPTAIEKEPESTAGRGKRGRRRKEEQEQPPAAVEATPEETGTIAEAGATDSDPSAAVDLAAEAAAEPGDDSTADGAVALSALPDDLFSDPLI